MKPINSDAVCDKLYQLCVDHQTYLEEQLHDSSNGRFGIGYRYNEYAISQLYDGQMMMKPTKMIIYVTDEGMDKKKLERLQQIAKNYDIIEELRCSLIDKPFYLTRESHQKLIDFNAIFSSAEIRHNLKAHSDSSTIRFLKNAAYLLASIFFGAGVLMSLRNKKSAAFWKSQGEIALDKMEDLLESVNDASNQNQIMSP